MAEEPETPQDEQPPEGAEQPPEEAAAAEPSDAPAEDAPAEAPAADEPAEAPAAEEPAAEESADAPAAEEPAAEEPAEAPAAEEPAEAPAAEEPAEAAAADEPAEAPAAEQPAGERAAPARPKPEIPGADLEVDIVPEGMDPLGRAEAEEAAAALAEAPETEAPVAEEPGEEPGPVTQAAIDLAAGARYTATGKRKTAVARVILKPGSGEYTINGRPLDAHFPRPTLQRNIRQPLETVGYDSRMDVMATLHGGGVSAQAGALRHGISRALIDADPNLRSELKRRGFLTRDPRVKERKKAGLKKARKRPQFSKR